MRVNFRRGRFAFAVGIVAVSLTLAACSGGTSTAAPGDASVSTEKNDADIRFAQGMIPHHQQAVEMAELAIKQAQNPEVRKLAEQIKGAQDPEIQQMLGFLRAWGAAAPGDSMDGMDHGGSGGHEGTGMMTPEELDQLKNAIGVEFDKRFLQLMIAHHEGAITDAKRELAEGVNPQAKQLATQIIAAQMAEITRMQQLLQTA